MKSRLVIDNAKKVITVTNSVFETLTAEEERAIARYEGREYHLDIVDDKKKDVPTNVKLTNKQILINASVGSREMKFTEEASERFIKMYNELKKEFCFQTAKGFYIELNKAINDTANDRTVEEVYSFYTDMINKKIA